MREMVTSAVVQEVVSGAVSFVFSSREEKASQEDLMERLQMAHIKLDLALERTRMMPITIVPLLRLRKKLKDVFKECDDMLCKARDHQQVVPSFRRKIMNVVLLSFIVPNKDMLSSSNVGRFEWFAKEADKFVRGVQSECSLSHYRFLNPLTRHLLEGRDRFYEMVQGSQTCDLLIRTTSVEEYGRVARLCFRYEGCKASHKTFVLLLALRLYESTNIIAVASKCLHSLGPQFKSLAGVAIGKLTQVLTQDFSYSDSVRWNNVVGLTTIWNPNPFCCISDELNKPCANNIISSELTGRFPQEVMFVSFDSCFSASEHYSRSSTDEVGINTIKSWPPLEMSVTFAPHLLHKLPDRSSLHQTEEAIQAKAIDCFIHQPDMTQYDMFWDSAHGYASFCVLKLISETRRAAKRRR